VAGVGGEEEYTKRFTDQAVRLYEVLIGQLGFSPLNVSLLTELGSASEPIPAARATAEEVRRSFEKIKSAAGPESLVLIVLIGHGSFDGQNAKFNLVGPDLTAKDYSALLNELPSRRIVFINSASSSGEFIKPLSGQGRVIITATRSGNEQNLTVFADHLIAALSDEAADSDKNGRISALEAFNYATKLTADWYKRMGRLATEHALIDDNGDGAGHEGATDGDGSLAKITYLDSRQIQEAAGDQELERLLKRKEQLEAAIEELKSRKDKMRAEEYEAELERLLLELARLNQSIKAHQQRR
jgi:hypothetical protein